MKESSTFWVPVVAGILIYFLAPEHERWSWMIWVTVIWVGYILSNVLDKVHAEVKGLRQRIDDAESRLGDRLAR